MLLGATNILSKSIVFGKSEIGTMHCFGMTHGISVQNQIRMNNSAQTETPSYLVVKPQLHKTGTHPPTIPNGTIGSHARNNNYQARISKQRIVIKEGNDILRWGYCPSGDFNVYEACSSLIRNINEDDQGKSHKIWNLKQWLIIALFLWLLLLNKTLTWDKLQSPGLQSPSIYVLCFSNSENANHLQSSFSFSASIWDHLVVLFRQTNRIQNNVLSTLQFRRDSPFTNPIANRAWQLIHGFILWDIWKEHNRRTFKNIMASAYFMWQAIINKIRETILSLPWSSKDWECNQPRKVVLTKMGLSPYSLGQTPSCQKIRKAKRFSYFDNYL